MQKKFNLEGIVLFPLKKKMHKFSRRQLVRKQFGGRTEMPICLIGSFSAIFCAEINVEKANN